ncbi:hypothetical protein GZ77_26085 [Endozoicomonas montiporae]|uniref:Gp5/Type VI secretion system Vgr protein OB-fold domain-containing protein n=1 Tax=Endozoicomonas montiporae TaxID=1027273 RepID=A0A081MYL2_9GAMM|nr:phage baseplate assembly protein V [Endozoicomonas montiporae]KEQ11285.1 hypothetical protein GZ77_26085 [Endozoicomonas montiporae]
MDLLEDLRQRLEELERRISQMVVRGTIAEVNPDKHIARVSYGPNLTTGWLQWKPLRTGGAITWWCPSVGEGVTVISDGDLSLGEIIPGSYYGDFPAPSSDPDLHLVRYEDGAEISYHQKDSQLKAVLPDAGKTELVSKGGIKFVGDTEIDGGLHVTKAIKADKDITDHTRSMADDRGIFNGHDHIGNQGKPTSPPQQQQ